MSEEELNKKHTKKMQKHKANKDRMRDARTTDKGLLIVHTGPGKGKTTAAMGMAMRVVGHGGRVGIIQFIKGSGNWDTAERRILEAFEGQVDFRIMGEGFTWDTQNRARDIETCAAAWDVAKDWIKTNAFDMVLLDELNIALRNDYLDVSEVIEVVNARSPDMHVIITGRNAKPELIESADLVTEMTMIKHPVKQGIKAQAGIEF